MSKQCLRILLLAFVVLMLATSADARFSVEWRAEQAGHLKMWWTVGGVRDPYPFIDSDIVPPPGGVYIYGSIAPRDNINDVHQYWRLHKNEKTSSTDVVTDMAYAHASFSDFLLAQQVESVSWYALADALELSDVEVLIDLTPWTDHLKHHPLPDPSSLFHFNAGSCPDLPGYQAFNVTTCMPFSGEMEVVGTTKLYVPEPVTLTVQSTCISGVEIDGTTPGVTPFASEFLQGQSVTLIAPSAAFGSDAGYIFRRWIIDGIEQPLWKTSLHVTMDQSHVVTAMYGIRADVNDDGVINILDLIKVRNLLGGTCAPLETYVIISPGEELLADAEVELTIMSDFITIDNSPILFKVQATISRLATVALTSQQPAASTPIEIVQLELASAEPILITYDNGSQSLWDMRIELSDATSGIGEMTFTKNYEYLGDVEFYFVFLPRLTVTDLIEEQEYVFTDTAPLELVFSGEFVYGPLLSEAQPAEPRLSGPSRSSGSIMLPESVPEFEPIPCEPEGRSLHPTRTWTYSRIQHLKFNYEGDRTIELDRDKLDSLVSWTAWLSEWLREMWLPNPPHPAGTYNTDFALSRLVSIEVTWRVITKSRTSPLICLNGVWQRGIETLVETHEDSTTTLNGPFENYPQATDAVMGVRP